MFLQCFSMLCKTFECFSMLFNAFYCVSDLSYAFECFATLFHHFQLFKAFMLSNGFRSFSMLFNAFLIFFTDNEAPVQGSSGVQRRIDTEPHKPTCGQTGGGLRTRGVAILLNSQVCFKSSLLSTVKQTVHCQCLLKSTFVFLVSQVCTPQARIINGGFMKASIINCLCKF